jgi:hypothetical protein
MNGMIAFCGCITETGRLFLECRNCPIRKCAKEKELESCAYCEEYVCKILEEFFATEPSVKTQLDKRRKQKD